MPLPGFVFSHDRIFRDRCKGNPMSDTILDEIDAHNSRIGARAFGCGLRCCPKCHATPECFKLHEVRPRRFRVVRERSALTVDSFVCRWKCPLCKRTSVDYPPFSLPYKRYVKEAVLGFSAEYLDQDSASYRQVTHDDNGLSIFYESVSSTDIDERRVAPSTTHRWITSLAGLRLTLLAACGLIRQKSSRSGFFRRILPMPPRKFRTDERSRDLGMCHRLVLAEVEFRSLFNESVFPRLATATGWG